MLGHDAIFRIEPAGFGQEALGLVWMAEHSRPACLLDEVCDSMLMRQSRCLNVLGLGGVNAERFGKFSLRLCNVSVVEQPHSGEVGLFGLLRLSPADRRRRGFGGCCFSRHIWSRRLLRIGRRKNHDGDRKCSCTERRRVTLWKEGHLGCWLDEGTGLSDTRDPAIEPGSDVLEAWTLACWRTSHAVANLHGIHLKFGKRAAESIAVHAELICGLALVAFVVRENLKNVAPLELPNGVSVGDACTVHLNNETVQFALQRFTPCWSSNLRRFLIVTLAMQFDPIGCVVLEFGSTVLDELLEVVRYNEGYRMCPFKEIGSETRIFKPAGGGKKGG